MLQVRRWLKLNLILTLGIFFTITNSYGVISEDNYDFIHTIAEHVLSFCPPAECVVLGVGRSPTPILAYFESRPDIPKDYKFDIPLSHFRYGVEPDEPPLSDAQEIKLFKHFKQFLPNSIGNKRILMIDYGGNSGASLVASQHYFSKFLSHEHLKNYVDSAIVVKKYYETQIHPDIPHLIVLPDENELVKKMHDQGFDEFAPHGTYFINKDDNNNKVNNKYNEIIEEFRSIGASHSPKMIAGIQLDNEKAEDDLSRRKRQAYGLRWRLDDQNFEGLLFESLNDNNQEVRDLVTSLLFTTQKFFDKHNQLLIKAYDNQYVDVKRRAVKYAAKYSNGKAQAQLLQLALNPQRSKVTRLEAAGLIDWVDGIFENELLEVALKDTDSEVRKAGFDRILNDLVSLDQEVIKDFTQDDHLKRRIESEVIGTLMKSEDHDVKEAVKIALASVSQRTKVALILRMVGISNNEVRSIGVSKDKGC